MYRLGDRVKNKRHGRHFWIISLVVCLLLIVCAVILLLRWLKPNTSISQPATHTSSLTYTGLRHYKETDFSIDLPADWRAVAKPLPGSGSQGYGWQTATSQTDGQTLEIYEDTIPTNFPVNRLLIVQGQGGKLTINGQASADCASFVPQNAPAPDQLGIAASWQGVNFLCDKRTQPRTVTGTGSADGINTVNLKSPASGTVHKFFFTYVDYTQKADYQPFYDALKSLRLK